MEVLKEMSYFKKNELESSMQKIYFIQSLLIFLIFISSCETERFTGYQHEADELIETAIVQGLVRNTFTDELLPEALVRVGSMETLTNERGYFLVNFLMSDDVRQNKPVKINLSANKYYSKSVEKIILPLKNHFSFTLDRAAPVIDTTVVFKVEDASQDTIQNYICQAVVGDYQGPLSIDSVVARLSFRVPGSRPFERDIHLQRVSVISGRTSYWQAAFREQSVLELIPHFWIIATDNEQYCDSLFYYNEEINDQPLF